MARSLSTQARRKMIEAAQELAVEHGVAGVTLDAVARRSGVAKTTIYRHFESGDHLLLEAVAELIECVEAPDTGTLRGDLAAALAGFTDAVEATGLRRLGVSMLHRSLDDAEFAEMHRAMVDQKRSPVRVILQRAIARGEMSPDTDLDVVVPFVEGPFAMQHLLSNRPIDDAEREVWLDLIIRALT